MRGGGYLLNAPNQAYSKNFLLFGYGYTGIGKNLGVNIGDHIQTISVANIIKKLYPSLNCKFWDRDNLSNYNGEKAFTVMQGWFSFEHCYSFMPNCNILPVFIGTHFTENTQEKIIRFMEENPDYFKNKVIGCRDNFTKEFFKSAGFEAYLSRCLTLTLPKRQSASGQDKIFMVDIPNEWLKYFPQNIVKDAVFKNQRSLDPNKNDGYYYNSTDIYMQKAKEQLEMYKNQGKLVITTCLHCAAPCVAMGVPTVLIVNNSADCRYSALKGILKIYSINDLINKNIDFSPEILDIEELKSDMIKNVELSIKQELGEEINIDELKSIRNKIEEFSII